MSLFIKSSFIEWIIYLNIIYWINIYSNVSFISIWFNLIDLLDLFLQLINYYRGR